MKNSVFFLMSILSFVNSAIFTSFFDSDCTLPIVNTLSFTDVCTWSSSKYSGSFSVNVQDCLSSSFNAYIYNLSESPVCNNKPNYIIPVTTDCLKYDTFYVKGTDFTCESNNTTYNILAHFESDCKDGGIPFSISLGLPYCQGDSFAPDFLNWDTFGNYSNPFYQLEIYNTTNGICQDKIATYQTQEFPVNCLASIKPFQNIYLDIYNAFPV